MAQPIWPWVLGAGVVTAGVVYAMRRSAPPSLAAGTNATLPMFATPADTAPTSAPALGTAAQWRATPFVPRGNPWVAAFQTVLNRTSDETGIVVDANGVIGPDTRAQVRSWLVYNGQIAPGYTATDVARMTAALTPADCERLMRQWCAGAGAGSDICRTLVGG